MDSSLPPISAVIPNRNGLDLLPRTLSSLLAELPADRNEVLVIDDASTDDSVAMLAREFPAVRVIALSQNVGFGAATNLGLAEARHELVLLLNSDMLVTPGSIALLAEHFRADDVFAAGPQYVDSSAVREAGEVRPQLGSPAGGGLFSRSKFLELRGFDPLYYPFYWEDLDLGWRAWRRGWRIIYDTRVSFLHLASATISRSYSPAYIARIRARNRYLFGWKNFTSRSLRRYHTLKIVTRAITDLIRRLDASAIVAIPSAWRIARKHGFFGRRCTEGLTDQEILRASATEFSALLGL